jgi:hypothetical protein
LEKQPTDSGNIHTISATGHRSKVAAKPSPNPLLPSLPSVQILFVFSLLPSVALRLGANSMVQQTGGSKQNGTKKNKESLNRRSQRKRRKKGKLRSVQVKTLLGKTAN